MEPEHVEQRITWLDEQRRKDAETIGRISERLEALDQSLSAQTKQVQNLSSDVSRLSAVVARATEFDETVNRHRLELTRFFEEAENRRNDRESSLEELRKRDQMEISNAVSELREKLGNLETIDQSHGTLREEMVRLSRNLDAQSKRIGDLASRGEDQSRTLTLFEESRKQDNRRVTDLQSETSEIRKKLDTLHGSIDALEDRARRLETRIGEVVTGENERREVLALWREQQSLRLADFEREWKNWEHRFEAFEKQANELDDRMLAYEETYRNLKEMREEMNAVIDRLERRITEITEMQRLAEARTKQEWTTFQADDQKRWNSYKLTVDEQWREHNRFHEKAMVEIQTLEDNLADMAETVTQLDEIGRRQVVDLLTVIREWATDVENRSKKVR